MEIHVVVDWEARRVVEAAKSLQGGEEIKADWMSTRAVWSDRAVEIVRTNLQDDH